MFGEVADDARVLADVAVEACAGAVGAGRRRLPFRLHIPAGGFETVAEGGHVDAVVVQREVRAEPTDEVEVELRIAAGRMEGERLREAVDIFL